MHHQFGAEDFIWEIAVKISHSLVRPEVLSLDWLLAIPLSIGAYLLGSIPSAYILVYMVRGVDIRQVGTRNVGAMNAFDQVGPWGGLLVLLADGGKGVLAALLPGWVGAPDWVVFLTATLAVAGHNWPVFLNFRGGKRGCGHPRHLPGSTTGADHDRCGADCAGYPPDPQRYHWRRAGIYPIEYTISGNQPVCRDDCPLPLFNLCGHRYLRG